MEKELENYSFTTKVVCIANFLFYKSCANKNIKYTIHSNHCPVILTLQFRLCFQGVNCTGELYEAFT